MDLKLVKLIKNSNNCRRLSQKLEAAYFYSGSIGIYVVNQFRVVVFDV